MLTIAKEKPLVVYRYQNRMVGKLYADGVFRKTVNKKEHQLKSPLAWAIDASTFEDVERRAHLIGLNDPIAQEVWSISPKHFREHCGRLDREHGEQYFCTLHYFTCKSLKHWDPIAPVAEPVQRPLL